MALRPPAAASAAAERTAAAIAEAVEASVTRVLEEREAAAEEALQQLERPDGADELERLRERRLRELRVERARAESRRAAGFGAYAELHDERAFFDLARGGGGLVLHFYRPTTRRCEIVDAHLARIAPRRLGTRFAKINAEKAQFLADRFGISVLPTIALLKKRKLVHLCIGFEELGRKDDFETRALEDLIDSYNIFNDDDAEDDAENDGEAEG